MNREEIVNMFEKSIDVDSADAEQNYSECSKVLDRILLEVEDYKKSLEAKGIELHVNRSEKNLQTTDYGLDTVINVEGIKEKNRNFIQKEYG